MQRPKTWVRLPLPDPNQEFMAQLFIRGTIYVRRALCLALQ